MDRSEFNNKNIESMEEVGPALKKIIHFRTIRGKFSSVHPDLAAEGITRVEVGEEGLHFIRSNLAGKEISVEESLNEKEEDDELLKLALEKHSRREEEILARDLELTM